MQQKLAREGLQKAKTKVIASKNFVKWAGGKRQLLAQFEAFFPQKITRYHEPFVGGGSVAFHIMKQRNPEQVFLSDVNKELINCYNVIKLQVEELIWSLKRLKSVHSKETYYKMRAKNLQTLDPVSRAARFIYLNQTCFNGLYRVNKKGQFNVPIGSYTNPQIVREHELREIAKQLRKATIFTAPFESVVQRAKKGDFIYFDPPYYPINKSSFTAYSKDSFLEDAQIKLAEIFKKLDARGCLVMLSNSDTNFIRRLYREFNISEVYAKRMINCDSSKRGAITELVVTNYNS